MLESGSGNNGKRNKNILHPVFILLLKKCIASCYYCLQGIVMFLQFEYVICVQFIIIEYKG